MLDFDFGTYNDIKNAINSAGIMKYTLIGGQTVAATWVLVKFIHGFIKDTYQGQNKYDNFLENLSLLAFVLLCPYAMDILDNTFSVVETYIKDFKGSKLPTAVKDTLIDTISGNINEAESSGIMGFFMSLTEIGLSDLLLGFMNILLGIVAFILWAIDSAIFAIFYTERLIILEFYRFIFPMFVAFVGFDGLRNDYLKWVKGFIGILILPIPYIAVHHGVDAISDMIVNKNQSPYQAVNILVTIVVLLASMGMKYKILSQIGRTVKNLL